MREITIKSIQNGYIIDDQYFSTLEAAYEHLLAKFEGRSTWFGARSYGAVHVSYKPSETWTSPGEVDPA